MEKAEIELIIKNIGEILIEKKLSHFEILGILEGVKSFFVWQYIKDMEKGVK